MLSYTIVLIQFSANNNRFVVLSYLNWLFATTHSDTILPFLIYQLYNSSYNQKCDYYSNSPVDPCPIIIVVKAIS